MLESISFFTAMNQCNANGKSGKEILKNIYNHNRCRYGHRLFMSLLHHNWCRSGHRLFVSLLHHNHICVLLSLSVNRWWLWGWRKLEKYDFGSWLFRNPISTVEIEFQNFINKFLNPKKIESDSYYYFYPSLINQF
jgi:hypothetical protein